MLNKAFISNADKQTLIRQLILDMKTPLTTAQVTVNSLEAIQTTSPSLRNRHNDAEPDTAQMLRLLDDSLTHAIDILDFYGEAIGSQ